MDIKEAKIIKYGGIKNLDVKFKNGFNVIYGKNEAGKSTLQSFINNMLFGVDNKRSKDIRQNERVKLMPFGESSAMGELTVCNDECDNNSNTDISIIRTFGSSKKNDMCKIISSISGMEEKEYTLDSPGVDLLGVNRQTFLNTLYIKQLGSFVEKGKNDEIISKIAGLYKDSEEEVSFEEAIKNLSEARKEIEAPRKGGVLDNLKNDIIKLQEERYERLKISEENINEEKKYIKLKKDKEKLLNDIESLEAYKKYFKKIKLQNEYKDIELYVQKIEKLKERKTDMDKMNIFKRQDISVPYIEHLKDENIRIKLLKDNIEKLKEERAVIEESSLEEKERLQFSEIFYELDDDIYNKMISIKIENEDLEKRIRNYEQVVQEVNVLTHEINEEMKNENSYAEKNFQDINEVLQDYEYEIRNINLSMADYNKKQEEYKIINKKNNRVILSTAIIIVSLICSLTALLYNLKINSSLLFIFIGVIMIATIFIAYKIVKKNNELLTNYKNDQIIEDTKKKIEILEQSIEEICDSLNVDNYEELLLFMKDYEARKNKIELLKQRKKDKENILYSLGGVTIYSKLENNKKIIDIILEKTKSISLEEFFERYKKFQKFKDDLKEIQYKIKSIDEKLNSETEKYEQEFGEFNESLKELSITAKGFEENRDELEAICDKISQKENIEKSIKSNNDMLSVLMKDKNIEDIKKELSQVINLSNNYSYENEEQIDEKLREIQKKLIEVEKDIKDSENKINNINSNYRKLSDIEEDIEIIKEQIEAQQKKVAAIDIAIDTLNSSFKEMQKDFGPIINDHVGEYLSILTEGKYKNVKVSENYSLHLRNNDGSLVEAEFLSNGTWDQIYFALRLAFIDLLFGDKVVPIILDEPFSQYDDDRMKRSLELLYKLRNKRQILLFSCQEREKKYLERYNDINEIIIGQTV